MTGVEKARRQLECPQLAEFGSPRFDAQPRLAADRRKGASLACSSLVALLLGGDVRLDAAQSCQGPFQENTLREGRTAFSRTVEIGGVGVITDELPVCLGAGDVWMPFLSSLHGPAPARIDITCDLD